MLTFYILSALVLWMAYLMWEPYINYLLFRRTTPWDVSLDYLMHHQT